MGQGWRRFVTRGLRQLRGFDEAGRLSDCAGHDDAHSRRLRYGQFRYSAIMVTTRGTFLATLAEKHSESWIQGERYGGRPRSSFPGSPLSESQSHSTPCCLPLSCTRAGWGLSAIRCHPMTHSRLPAAHFCAAENAAGIAPLRREAAIASEVVLENAPLRQATAAPGHSRATADTPPCIGYYIVG